MSRSKPGSEEGLNRSVGWRALVPLLLGVGIWLLPVPRGLTANAWWYFALCVAVIAALITEPIPGPVAGLVGVTAAAALLLIAPDSNESIRWALSGFSNGTVWLIFVAFTFGLGYEKTGLGRRIALSLVRLLGRRTLGLGYAVALADLVLAPLMPSNTARSGGTIFPIIRSIPAVYRSFPAKNPRRIGAYLMWTAFAAQSVTSSMFLTANAANLFAVSFMKETAKISIGWAEWAVGFLPVGLLLFVSFPALAYVIYPPRVKASRNVPRWAARELARMGPISGKELLMAAVALLGLLLWVFGGERLNAPTVALIALCLMILTRVIEWSDVLAHKDAWRVLLWFGTLLTLADGLSRVGFLRWFARGTTTVLTDIPVVVMMPLFIAAFFIAHYMFASLTAHATALFPVFLATGMAVPGMPVRPLALALCYTLGLMGVLTPYATGPAPIYFGSGYITRKEFWTLGSIFGAIYLLALLAVGVPYLLRVSP